jgi:FtsP/CotA-like multicopper oxidase with cupredoxin domain
VIHVLRHSRRRFLGGLAGALLLPASAEAATGDSEPSRELESFRLGSGDTVEYWIGATPVTWNIIPNGKDPIGGETYEAAKTTIETVVYKAYTANWAALLPDSATVTGDNDGIPGPLIRARAGDTILVHFKNFDQASPHSMHFHGVHYDTPSDGAYIPGVSGPGANVAPNQTFTYKLLPGADSFGVWPYHDHSPSMDDSIAGGLYGAMSILGVNEKKPDREFVVFFQSMKIATATGSEAVMTINGRSFIGNTPTFRAKVGDVVQWDVLALGDDFHAFHVHGHRWLGPGGIPQDVQTVAPAESFRIRWTEDKVGTWLYHCHVEQHMMTGMIGEYVVTK